MRVCREENAKTIVFFLLFYSQCPRIRPLGPPILERLTAEFLELFIKHPLNMTKYHKKDRLSAIGCVQNYLLSCFNNLVSCRRSECNSPDTKLTAKALTMAFASRARQKGVIFHSDQGTHYTSRKFRQRFWRYQIKKV